MYRTQCPIRFRRVRDDASLRSLTRTIERKLGIPTNSVLIVRPDGRKMRSDAKVRALREIWDNQHS